MPIKPENRGKYPDDWIGVRARILERAGGTCEGFIDTNGRVHAEEVGGALRCGAPNGSFVFRRRAEPWTWLAFDSGSMVVTASNLYPDPPVGRHLYMDPRTAAEEDWRDAVRVVLTTAHVDQDPTNNDDSNLRSWCQRCHLTFDQRARRNSIQKGIFDG